MGSQASQGPDQKSFMEYLRDPEQKYNLDQEETWRGGSGLSPLFKNQPDLSIREKIREESLKNNIDPNLVRALIQTESNFKPNAVSPKGAMGLMQLMPDTAKGLGVENPMDPMENIEGGTKFLGSLLEEFQDRKLALAAYNAGPGAVRKYKGIPPYKETQDYIAKIDRLLGINRQK
jgi:soluble lytic murein transglycosylase-like protein